MIKCKICGMFGKKDKFKDRNRKPTTNANICKGCWTAKKKLPDLPSDTEYIIKQLEMETRFKTLDKELLKIAVQVSLGFAYDNAARACRQGDKIRHAFHAYYLIKR